MSRRIVSAYVSSSVRPSTCGDGTWQGRPDSPWFSIWAASASFPYLGGSQRTFRRQRRPDSVRALLSPPWRGTADARYCLGGGPGGWMMDVKTLHRRSVESWQRYVDGIGADQWDLPTPCTDWDVRALVN